MSGRHPTEKERARQAERLATLATEKVETPQRKKREKEPQLRFINRNCLYSPTTLRRVMGIGIRYYNTLMAAGLPHKEIGGRFWFSGLLVIEFFEGKPLNETNSAGAAR